MANCVTYELTCPIGATGGECRWSISCCDGSFQRVTLLEGQTAQNSDGGEIIKLF